jgi:MFS family permease
MFASIAGGPLGGYLSDHFRNRKFFIIGPGLGASVGILLFGIANPAGLAFLIPLVGFLDAMVFSTMYASVRLYPEIGKYHAPLGISIINSVQILFSFTIPIIFTQLVYASGGNYSPGWFFIGAFAIVTMLFVLLLREPFKAAIQG